MKTCSKCGVQKDPQAFHVATGGRLRADCRDCRNAVTRAWRERTQYAGSLVQRRSHLKSVYGLAEAQYDQMLTDQGGCCAICQGGLDSGRFGVNKHLDVDHCHKTGKIRGLLCSKCNRGIGQLNDDPALLRAAITYLESF